LKVLEPRETPRVRPTLDSIESLERTG